MRYTGVVLVALSLLTAGMYAVTLTHRRSSELDATVMLFQLIENDLSYKLTPFPTLVGELSQSGSLKMLDFLPECASLCAEGADFPAAWHRGVSESRMLLNREEREKLMRFGDFAGTTDVQGQLNICRMYSEEFERSYQRADSFRRKYTGLFFAMGALLALLAIVLLW